MIDEGGWSVAAELRPVGITRTLHMVRVPESVIIAVKRRRNVAVDWRITILRRLDSCLQREGSLLDSQDRRRPKE